MCVPKNSDFHPPLPPVCVCCPSRTSFGAKSRQICIMLSFRPVNFASPCREDITRHCLVPEKTAASLKLAKLYGNDSLLLLWPRFLLSYKSPLLLEKVQIWTHMGCLSWQPVVCDRSRSTAKICTPWAYVQPIPDSNTSLGTVSPAAVSKTCLFFLFSCVGPLALFPSCRLHPAPSLSTNSLIAAVHHDVIALRKLDIYSAYETEKTRALPHNLKIKQSIYCSHHTNNQCLRISLGLSDRGDAARPSSGNKN